MPHQNPSHMSADEIVQEIRDLRRGIEQSVHRITDLSLTLYSRARRRRLAISGEQEPEDPIPYVVFANGWARMATSLRQGVQRMDRTDRVITHRLAPEEEEKPEPASPSNPPSPPPHVMDDAMEELVSLYGGEIVNDAFSR